MNMTNAQKIRLAIGVIVFGLLVWFVYYAGTHGRISITNLGDKKVLVTLLNNESSLSSEVSNGSFVKSGTYTIQNNIKGQVRLASVTVPGWFGTATLTYGDIKTAHIDRQAALTFENFFSSGSNGFISYTDVDGFASHYTTHPVEDPFGGKSSDTTLVADLTSPIVARDGTAFAFTEGGVVRYSFLTKQYTNVANIETEVSPDADKFPRIERSSDIDSDSIIVYEGDKNEIKIIDNYRDVTTLKSTRSGSLGGSIDVNKAGWVIATNTSESPKSTNKLKDEEEKLPFQATIGKSRSQQTSQLNIGLATYISDIALSPSGKYLAVGKDGYLWVYEVATGEPIITNPIANANQLFWKGTKLYTLSAELGVTVFNEATKQILPISLNTSESLSFSHVIPIGDKLYVSAYNTDFGSDIPDGYVIDLERDSDGITETLAKELPLNTNNYDVNYLGNTIYVRVRNLAASPGEVKDIKDNAQRRIEQVIPSDILKRCKIVFTT